MPPYGAYDKNFLKVTGWVGGAGVGWGTIWTPTCEAENWTVLLKKFKKKLTSCLAPKIPTGWMNGSGGDGEGDFLVLPPCKFASPCWRPQSNNIVSEIRKKKG